ncbi:hypothetical protein ACU4E1_33070, partial [Pseudomonas aeruginosa]
LKLTFSTESAGSSPSLPDGSNPSAAIVQSASDVQCSRLLKTTDDELDKSVHDLLTEISQEADMRNCFVEMGAWEEDTEKRW